MLYYITNSFHNIALRASIAASVSFILCMIFGPKIITFLKAKQKFGQPIRNDGPESHLLKSGTPTMGGLMIIAPTLISTMLFADLKNLYIWITLYIMIGYGILGFIDDYLKVTKKNALGVSGRYKLCAQMLIALTACIAVQHATTAASQESILIPFAKYIIDLGYFYIAFAIIVIIGSSNAVNLTDGLDGLATVPIALSTICFAIISYVAGNSVYAHYLHVQYISGCTELVIICASIFGACIGFLWYNAQPAQIFMGDTGSLSLGGVLGIVSVITKHEITFVIIGGLFVVETLSVIIQVYYFKISGGKRIFRMAPIHHHFEQLGWSESRVVVRFWIIATIFAFIGIFSVVVI